MLRGVMLHDEHLCNQLRRNQASNGPLQMLTLHRVTSVPSSSLYAITVDKRWPGLLLDTVVN